jgi:hypothetical protein
MKPLKLANNENELNVLRLILEQGWRNFLGRVPKLSINFEKISLRPVLYFEEQRSIKS